MVKWIVCIIGGFVGLTSTASAQTQTIVRCQFQKLPPITMRFYDRETGKDSTMQVGTDKPVIAYVGSNLVTAAYGAQELTFSLRLPASVTISAPGQDTKTYSGRCKTTLPH